MSITSRLRSPSGPPRLDFLLVGGPRCGTTFIDGFLRQHPAVFLAPKELHYFGSDLEFDSPRRTLANYEQHLAGAAPGQRVGEASVWYLHSELAAAEAAAYRPDLKIVVSLRSPVQWLQSVHGMLVHYGDEPLRDFADALAAVPRRRRGIDLPPHARPPRALLYDDLVRYVDDLNRWVEAFGRERVHVVLFDDLRANPAPELRQLCAFLDLPADFPGFDRALGGSRTTRNAHRRPRSWALQRLATGPRALRVLRQHKRGPPGTRALLRAILRWNVRLEPRPELPPEQAAELAVRFRPQVEALEAFLGRELPAWTGQSM